MRTFNINISPQLENIEVRVKNGKKFAENLIKGEFYKVTFTPNEVDFKRIKSYLIKNADDFNYKDDWYLHCNMYNMDICLSKSGICSINTYRPFGNHKTRNTKK